MESLLPLIKKYSRRKSDRDIFKELKPFKITEVLLVATYYDSYSIIREDRFFERIAGEYLQLNLYSAPRITSASNSEEIEERLSMREYEMVIIMAGADKEMPVKMSHKIKQLKPDLPILLLANNNSDLRFFDAFSGKMRNIDRVFAWNGDFRVFLAMIKYMEDKMNVASDTKLGDVRVILLVEDSQRYYSRYLPLLYSIILRQTQVVAGEETSDQVNRILKMRVRPKVLLVSTYEEAIELVDLYRDNLLGVISDVGFYRDGVECAHAGIDLIKYVRERANIPLLLQSADAENRVRAGDLGAEFIDKNSEQLTYDLSRFIQRRLGFGDFVFTNSSGQELDVAHNLKEFEVCVRVISAESLIYHTKRNDISIWLMARGEISLAKRIRPFQIENFEDVEQMRHAILEVFDAVRFEKLRGRTVYYNPRLAHHNRFVMRMGEGFFGGKGRGLAFLCNYIENVNLDEIIPEIEICIPPTIVIGSMEFTTFLEENELVRKIYGGKSYKKVKELFIDASLPAALISQLRSYVEVFDVPLAIRSSGMFEDSLYQPFAGVYETYILPNNHFDMEVRLRQLQDAIKLIYASIFSRQARTYFDAVHHKVEEENMSVIIQHLVGQKVNGRFYPHIAGVAQSYNYYPLSYMKPEDGFSVLCIGLGKYVVGGEKSWRFCPRYPALEFNSLGDQIKESQTHFYALDLNNPDVDIINGGEEASIIALPIKSAEEDGNLFQVASVYDFQNDRLVNDFSIRGPRVLNFANILKYDSIPLAKSIDLLLHLFKDAMGAPVELEFAVDLKKGGAKPTLYLLQIKPLIREESQATVNFEGIDSNSVWLQSARGMGNGRIEDISDVVFMNIPEFDRTKTPDMAEEIDKINHYFDENNRDYILIGPGRWGTHDRFTGIPVYWSQISRARVIVEMGLEDFPLDASLGSHFFHNVTSMNVGYFSVHRQSEKEWVDLDFLASQPVIRKTRYFTHVRFASPCAVLMDGKNQRAAILRPQSS